MADQSALSSLLEKPVEALGYQLWGVQLLNANKARTLRVIIDHPKGIGLEDCEIVSHQVSQVLDVNDPLPGHYQLEVSSPGIDRPLFYPWQYQRYCGQQLRLTVYSAVGRPKKIKGTLMSVDDDGQVVMMISGETLTLPLASIQKANVVGEATGDVK